VRRKWIVIAVALPILVVAWWFFRPEKLWINQKVNEPPPFASRSGTQPLFTGLLEAKAHPTSGRATIYESPDGNKMYLRLTDFTTSNSPNVHIVLARANDPALDHDIVKGDLDHVELGKLNNTQGDQSYDLAPSVDLQKYNAVVIYDERSHTIFAIAREEPF
jgi:Electron transfer DM13